MKKLIIFELKKIFAKRLTLISIVAVLLLNMIFVISTCLSMYSFDGKSTDATGIAAINIDKAIAKKYQGTLTDEKVQQMLKEFKPTTDLHGMNVAYLYQNATQSSVHARFSDLNGNWNGLTVTDIYDDKEITIGYINGWLSVSQYMARVFIILSLMIILITAPVYSGEYGGVDSLILTTKYGKTKCSTAKNIATILAAFLITTFFVVINIVTAFAIYGHDGLDCSILFAPMSFMEGYIPYNITCGTLITYLVILAFASTISVTGITLFLSSMCKNQVVTLVASVATFMIPLILPISETNPLYRLVVLMPIYYSQFISIMSIEQIISNILYAVWSIPMATIIIGFGFIISRSFFAKHQVL